MLVKSWAACLLLATVGEGVLGAPTDRTPQDVAEDTVEIVQEVSVAKNIFELFAQVKAAKAAPTPKTTAAKKTSAKKTPTRKTTTTTTTKRKAKKTKTSKTTTTTTTTTTTRRRKPTTTPTTTTTTSKKAKKPAATSSLPPSSTSSPVPVASPVANARTPGKRGLAYNNPQFTNPFGTSPLPINASVPLLNTSLSSTSQVSWTYNWYMSPCTNSLTSCPTANPSLMHIPMLWSNQPALLSLWPSAVEAALARNVTHLFSFNEPDGCFTGSSCMSLSDAVSTYQSHMQPYSGRAHLGAPAVTNAGAPYGLDWLTRFMDACDGCTFDFVNVHWYSNKYAGANYFKSFINATRAVAGGRPIWVTEFALTDDEGGYTDAENESFLKEVMGWMDAQEDVAGYSFFMDTNVKGMLMGPDGMGKSSLGEVYDTWGNGTVKGGVWEGKEWSAAVGANATVVANGTASV